MIAAGFKRLFDWKIRGVRWVEIIGFVLVAAMIFSVYVAKAAAVSRQTVSRVINNEPSVMQGTRARVLRAIDDLGYELDAGQRAVNLPGPVACAVLPSTPRAPAANNISDTNSSPRYSLRRSCSTIV